MIKKVQEAKAFIESQLKDKPEIALILGSGLGVLAEEIESPVKIKYSEILNIRSSDRPGIILENNDNFIVISSIDYNIILYKDKFEELLELCKNDQVEELKNFGSTEKYLNDHNSQGWSLIIVSAYNNSKKTLKYLLEIGADINDRNNNGTTVLMYAKNAALRDNDFEIIDIILSCKPDLFAADYSNKNVFDYLKDQSKELMNYIAESTCGEDNR